MDTTGRWAPHQEPSHPSPSSKPSIQSSLPQMIIRTHELPSMIMANDCIFIKPSNGHARPNISPNTFIFTTGHCYSFIATLLVYHSHFTMFFYILLQSVVKCDESRFSMVCVSPWSNHLPSLLKGPSHVI